MKYFIIIFILNLNFTGLFGQWNQLGQEIDGFETNDRFGESIDLSESGNRIIIGATQTPSNNSTGYVKIYDWDETVWVQLGQTISGLENNEWFGRSVAMSSDGNKIAIGDPFDSTNGSSSGQVRCFEWNGINWVQLGINLNGAYSIDRFGESVSLSSDGNRLAVGSPLNSTGGSTSGQVLIYDWDGSSWYQVGGSINGIAGEGLGTLVSLSSNGIRLAIGAPINSTNGYHAGRVVIYQWDGSNWMILGDEILGENENSFSGRSVDLSCSGSVVAIGGPFNSDAGYKAGHVRVFEWDGINWMQKGTDIDGEAVGDWSGYSVSVSCSGERVAIGAPRNDETSNSAGQVRIFQWENTNWIQLGNDIDGSNVLSQSGLSSRLSDNGERIIIGAPTDNNLGDDFGKVKIYEGFEIVPVSTITDKDDILKLKISPNPTSIFVQVEIEGITNLENYNIIINNINGITVKSKRANTIIKLDLNSLSKGTYQVLLIDDKNYILKSEKLIIN